MNLEEEWMQPKCYDYDREVRLLLANPNFEIMFLESRTDLLRRSRGHSLIRIQACNISLGIYGRLDLFLIFTLIFKEAIVTDNPSYTILCRFHSHIQNDSLRHEVSSTSFNQRQAIRLALSMAPPSLYTCSKSSSHRTRKNRLAREGDTSTEDSVSLCPHSPRTVDVDVEFDIDGISVFLYTFNTNDVKSNLSCSFNINYHVEAYSRNVFCMRSLKKIKDLYTIKIGELFSHIGRFSFCLVSERPFNLSGILETLILAADMNYSNDLMCFSTNISIDNVEAFLKRVQEIDPSLYFFIESYGNKKYLSSVNFPVLFMTLYSTFSANVIDLMNIDVACTILPRTESVLFLAPKCFDILGFNPKYSLFFCDEMLNHHTSCLKEQSGVLKSSFGPVSKINFYSLTQDYFTEIHKIPFFPVKSFKRFLNDIYGYSCTNFKTKPYSTLIEEAYTNLKVCKRLGYRLELRTTGVFVSDIFSLLKGLIQKDFFVSMPLKPFLAITKENALMLCITNPGNTFEALAENLITETVLKEFFIKGSTNKHFLPKDVVDKIKTVFNRCLITPIVSMPSYAALSQDMLISLISNVLRLTTMGMFQKHIVTVRRFFTVFSSKNLYLSCKAVVAQYLHDIVKKGICKRHSISSLNIAEFVRCDLNSLIKETTQSLSSFVQHYFFEEISELDEPNYFKLANMCIKTLGIDVMTFKNMIYAIFINHGINLVPAVKSSKRDKISYFISLDLSESRIGALNRNEIVQRFIDLFNMRHKKPKRNPSRTVEEKIRILHGLIRYSSSSCKYKVIKYDFVYGLFYKFESTNAIHDALRVSKSQPGFYDLLAKAVLWDPSHYDVNMQLATIPTLHKYKSLEKPFRQIYQHSLGHYRPITCHNFSDFYKSIQDEGLISPQEYEGLYEIIKSRNLTIVEAVNEFSKALWVPLEIDLELTEESFLVDAIFTPFEEPTSGVILDRDTGNDEYSAVSCDFGNDLVDYSVDEPFFNDTTKNDCLREFDGAELIKQIKSKYKRKVFTARESLLYLFHSNDRPSASQWNNILSSLVSDNKLSCVSKNNRNATITFYYRIRW